MSTKTSVVEPSSIEDKNLKEKYDYEELRWNNAKPLYNVSSNLVPEEVQLGDESPQVASSERLEQDEEEQEVPRMPIYAEKTALLVVDVQPEYWSSCPSVRKDFPDFEKNFALTLKTARERRCKIIWVRADYRRESSPWLKQFERLSRGNKKRKDTTIELPCDPDNKEFGWEPFATPEGGEAIIAKTSWSSTSNTALFDILSSSAIDTVLVCGLITSVCVQHSAFGVFEAGYRTLLVEDSCGDRGRARHEAALALYGGYMYELIISKDLVDPETGMQKAKPIWFSKTNNGTIVSRSSSSESLGEKNNAKKRKITFTESDYHP